MPTRIISLDLIRALAVLLVIGRHIAVIKNLPKPENDVIHWLWALADRVGWVGVDLFFVLSGYLVSGLLFREYQERGTISPGRFLIRRGLKIYPAFYALLLSTYIVVGTVLKRPTPWQPFAAEAFFLQNYLYGIWGHTWSLAVEEHFYLLLILLTWLLVVLQRGSSDPFKWLLAVYGIAAVACLAARIIKTNTDPFNGFTHIAPTHLRIDSLLLGVALSYVTHFRPHWLRIIVPQFSRLLLVLSFCFLLPTAYLTLGVHPWVHTYGMTVFAWAGALMILGLQNITFANNIIFRPITIIGQHSYSIYLWHFPIAVWVMPVVRKAWAGDGEPDLDFSTLVMIYVVLCLTVGIGLSYLIEWPILKLRDRLFPRRVSGDPIPRATN